MNVGHVRVLPPETPGVPESVPYDGEYDYSLWCGARIGSRDVPGWETLNMGPTAYGFACTRPRHDDSTPHVCHCRNRRGEARFFVVWDGE